MLVRYALAWLPMVAIAMFSGALRDVLQGGTLPALHAHQVSSVMLILIFSVYTWLVDLVWPLQNARRTVLVGGLWLLVTVLADFAIGLLVANNSWLQLLQAYNLFAGRLWILVLASIVALPWLTFRIRQYLEIH